MPRIVYLLWLQGRDEAPDLVRLNLARWEALNPSYSVRVFDAADASARLEGLGVAIADMAPQAVSDILRVHLLLETGGIWADASVFPVRSLDEWLDDAVASEGFFAFERPGPDRPLSTWFLAATAGHPIVHAWWREVRRFWSEPRRLAEGIPPEPSASVSPAGAVPGEYPYFWFHYLFGYLLETDQEVAAAWNRCVKQSAGPPHALQRLFAGGARPTQAAIAAAVATAPVQKLDWRRIYPLDVLADL